MIHLILEKALQKTLELQPALAEKCKLQGEKNIVITLLPINLSWTISLINGEIRCFHGKNLGHTQPDLSITATPKALIALALHDDKTQLKMDGDVILAQLLQQCFHYSDIDWDSALGNSFSYPILAGLRQTKNKIQQIHQRLKNKTTDYFQEEIELVPFSSEINTFCHEVDELKLRMDRLEAHWQQARKA